ncbi:MAG: hypothetical protein JJU08_05945 [Rhodobacteraceae bacterium]|nr:hypothetical protein [Paracoccaceae bacterium]
MSGAASLRVQTGAEVSRRLGRVVSLAGKRIPLYRQFWAEQGMEPASIAIRELSDFIQFPIIDRTVLAQTPLEQRRDPRWPWRLIHTERSGGSTGAPLEVPVDPVSHTRRQLRFLRALVQCGYIPGDRFLMLSTRPTGRHPMLPGCFCADIRSSQQTLLRLYQQFRPRLLYGPLNTLLLLGQALDQEEANAIHRPQIVVSTAEQMAPGDRLRLREVFGVDPADFYGMSECGLIAWRPPESSSYRLADRDLFLEFLPLAEDSSLERLVITDQHAAVCMPLIRFDTGDLVQREMDLINAPVVGFRGRVVDCLWRRDRSAVSPYRVTLALEDAVDVLRYQVIQRRDLSLDVSLWVKDELPQQAVQRVETDLLRLMGEGVVVRVKQGSPNAAAGLRKFRPVRSEAGEEPCAY